VGDDPSSTLVGHFCYALDEPQKGNKGKQQMKKIVITMAMFVTAALSSFAQTVPVLLCPEPVTVTCAPADGAPATVTVRVWDPQGGQVTLVWAVDGAFFQTNDVTAGTSAATATAVPFSAVFGEGSHTVRVVASDGAETAACETTVTVVLDGAPAFTNLTASPSVLWPPNKKMRPIRLNLAVTNDCGAVTSRIVSVTSSEPIRGTSAFDRSPDWIIGTNGLSLQLRAERAGNNRAGRTYTITVEVMDAAGSTAQRTVDVTVPHDRRQGPHKSLVKQPKKAKKAKKK
jgi:hypothetical protein